MSADENKSFVFPIKDKDINDILFRIMRHSELETMRVHIDLLNGLYESIVSKVLRAIRENKP